MTEHIPEDRRKSLAASAPSQPPPPEIPAGGGTGHSPYPNYNVVSSDKWQLDWDEPTRRLVLDRVHNVPSYRFFAAAEVPCLEAVCARLFPQDDRPSELRIPIAPWIDDRLHRDVARGYRYAGMPSDQEAYRRGLRGIQETAHVLFEEDFEALDGTQKDSVLWHVSTGDPPGDSWQTLSARRFFGLLMDDAITEYYAHPTAWAEMGFNGPASPRGHIRFQPGMPDPWEATEGKALDSVEIVRHALERKESGS